MRIYSGQEKDTNYVGNAVSLKTINIRAKNCLREFLVQPPLCWFRIFGGKLQMRNQIHRNRSIELFRSSMNATHWFDWRFLRLPQCHSISSAFACNSIFYLHMINQCHRNRSLVRRIIIFVCRNSASCQGIIFLRHQMADAAHAF